MRSDLEDGLLCQPRRLTWQVDFHHATHLHPFMPPTSGITGGQFTIPTNSETAADVLYRMRLIATDSAGLTTETYRDILPETSDFLVTNNLGGGNVLVDGQTKQAPYAVTGVVNVQRSLEAPLNADLQRQCRTVSTMARRRDKPPAHDLHARGRHGLCRHL